MVRSLLFLAFVAACTADPSAGNPASSGACSEFGNLELVPLDIWGRDLAADLTLTSTPTAVSDSGAGPGVVLYRLGEEPVDLQFRWASTDHHALSSTLNWDGSDSFSVAEPTGEGRVAWNWGRRDIGGTTCPVWTVYAGLTHQWFAPSAAAPTRNAVSFHMDGESYWKDVASALTTTERRVTWATWWWESDFELIRGDDHATLSDSQRWANAALGMLENIDSAERRILINRFWAENSDYTAWLNTDEALLAYAEAQGDDLEVILQGNDTEVPIEGQYGGEAADFSFAARVLANPRYADRDVTAPADREEVDLELQVASWHQKAIVMDGATVFVSGMNTKAADWDSNEHLVYDPRRMGFDATESDREAVAAYEELPEFGPRKDYGVRLDGPAARDVEDILADRWNSAIGSDDMYAGNATMIALDEASAEVGDGALVQVTATMPEPWAVQAIRETHTRAFSNATEYIYIEDQYFRAPLMNDIIVQRMLAEDNLVLIVVTMDIATTDGGAKFTWISDETFRNLFPDRYLLLELRSVELLTDPDAWWDEAELVVQNIDTHSKLRIVDDRYLSVGSCNFNNRGYLYEGELNVAMLDEATVTAARTAVFDNLVGDEWSGMLSDDAQNNLDVLRIASAENETRLQWWEENAADLDAEEAESEWDQSRPSGFVYPLEISEGYEWDVGPDAF